MEITAVLALIGTQIEVDLMGLSHHPGGFHGTTYNWN